MLPHKLAGQCTPFPLDRLKYIIAASYSNDDEHWGAISLKEIRRFPTDSGLAFSEIGITLNKRGV